MIHDIKHFALQAAYKNYQKSAIWNRRHKFCTFLMCNLYDFQTDRPSLAVYSFFFQVEVKIFSRFDKNGLTKVAMVDKTGRG